MLRIVENLVLMLPSVRVSFVLLFVFSDVRELPEPGRRRHHTGYSEIYSVSALVRAENFVKRLLSNAGLFRNEKRCNGTSTEAKTRVITL